MPETRTCLLDIVINDLMSNGIIRDPAIKPKVISSLCNSIQEYIDNRIYEINDKDIKHG